MFVEGS
jgi:hypothetical protein